MVELSKTALSTVEGRLRRKFDGHPHMGKFQTMSCGDLVDTYGRFDTWHDVYLQSNAFGTFNNAFTATLGLDVENPPDGPPRTDCGSTLSE